MSLSLKRSLEGSVQKVLFHLTRSFYWLIRRALQIASIICLAYWVILLGYLTYNGLDNDSRDITVISFTIAVTVPPLLAAFLWRMSDWFRA